MVALRCKSKRVRRFLILQLILLFSNPSYGQVGNNTTSSCVSLNQPRPKGIPDPVSIVSALRSAPAKERVQAYQSLFGQIPGEEVLAHVPSLQLSFPRLSSEFESTAILQIDVGGGRTAFVLAKDRGSWFIIGKFDNVFRNLNRSYENMVETKSILPPFTEKALFIRTWESGSDGYAIRLEVFRMRKSTFDCVFAMIEEEGNTFGARDESLQVYDRRVLSLPDREYAGGPVIIVSHFRAEFTETQMYIPEVHLSDSVRIDCKALRWDTQFQSFQMDLKSTNKFCLSSSRKTKRSPGSNGTSKY